MKFLLDANLPRSAANVLRDLGYEIEDVRDVLLGGADDAVVAARAKAGRWIRVTRDFDFADIRNYPPQDYAGIVVLELPDDAIAAQVNQVLKSFASKPELLARLAGRLAISNISPARNPGTRLSTERRCSSTLRTWSNRISPSAPSVKFLTSLAGRFRPATAADNGRTESNRLRIASAFPVPSLAGQCGQAWSWWFASDQNLRSRMTRRRCR